MLPERLRPILALLSTVPVGTHDSAQNDFVTSLRSVPTELPQVARLRSAAGKGSYPGPCGLLATRAKLLTCPAVNLGPAFALFAKVLYSKNHNMFRTVGFLAMLAAVRPRECCNLKHSPRHTWRNQGPEHEEGGVSSLRPTLFNMGFFAAWLFFFLFHIDLEVFPVDWKVMDQSRRLSGVQDRGLGQHLCQADAIYAARPCMDVRFSWGESRTFAGLRSPSICEHAQPLTTKTLVCLAMWSTLCH